MGAFEVEDDGRIRVARLYDGARGVNLVVKVVDRGEVREVVGRADGEPHRVCEALVADETGAIYLSLWNDNIESVKPEQVLFISGGYVTSFRDSLRLNLSRYGGFSLVEEAPFHAVDLANNLSLTGGRRGHWRGL